MSRVQSLLFLLNLYWHPAEEFHHGDEKGADTEAHNLVRHFFPACKIVIHPSTVPNQRAFLLGDEVRDPLPLFIRNRRIVDATDFLITAPRTEEEEPRAGIWATIRYARDTAQKPYEILPRE